MRTPDTGAGAPATPRTRGHLYMGASAGGATEYRCVSAAGGVLAVVTATPRDGDGRDRVLEHVLRYYLETVEPAAAEHPPHLTVSAGGAPTTRRPARGRGRPAPALAVVRGGAPRRRVPCRGGQS